MRGKGWEGNWKANEGEKFENEERNAQERMPQKMQKRKSMWHGALVCICLTFKVTVSSKGQAHHRKKNKDYHLWVIFYIYLQHTKESKPLLVLRAGAGLTIQGRVRVLHHHSLHINNMMTEIQMFGWRYKRENANKRNTKMFYMFLRDANYL